MVINLYALKQYSVKNKAKILNYIRISNTEIDLSSKKLTFY